MFLKNIFHTPTNQIIGFIFPIEIIPVLANFYSLLDKSFASSFVKENVIHFVYFSSTVSQAVLLSVLCIVH